MLWLSFLCNTTKFTITKQGGPPGAGTILTHLEIQHGWRAMNQFCSEPLWAYLSNQRYLAKRKQRCWTEITDDLFVTWPWNWRQPNWWVCIKSEVDSPTTSWVIVQKPSTTDGMDAAMHNHMDAFSLIRNTHAQKVKKVSEVWQKKWMDKDSLFQIDHTFMLQH